MVIDIDSGFCMSYWRHFATFHIYICTKFILSRFLPCYRFTQYSNPVHDYNMPEVWVPCPEAIWSLTRQVFAASLILIYNIFQTFPQSFSFAASTAWLAWRGDISVAFLSESSSYFQCYRTSFGREEINRSSALDRHNGFCIILFNRQYIKK